jgi:hypothetical protein
MEFACTDSSSTMKMNQLQPNKERRRHIITPASHIDIDASSAWLKGISGTLLK